MFATDLTMKQYISEARFRDFLHEAERQRRIALAARPARRSALLDRTRARAASALIRAGHRLMPAETRDGSASAGGSLLELSPGR